MDNEERARRNALELLSHELGMAFSAMADFNWWRARTAPLEELDEIEQTIQWSVDALHGIEGVLYPARDRRGIGFVVWMIARRAWVAAPPGTKKLVVTTYEGERSGRRAVLVRQLRAEVEL